MKVHLNYKNCNIGIHILANVYRNIKPLEEIYKGINGVVYKHTYFIADIKDTIEKVAPTGARVLITGENGVGKELVARWIHEKSNRSKGPMIEVNCAAIPGELIESELFGHEKGSFTGAIKDKIGAIEEARGGTLTPLETFGFIKGVLPNENIKGYLKNFKEITEFYLNKQ